MKPDFSGKGLRSLKRESVVIAQKTASSPVFQEKFKHPRKDRVYASLSANPMVQMLRDWRKKNGFYVKEAADKIGVPVETYRGWEKGKHLPTTAARQLIRSAMASWMPHHD